MGPLPASSLPKRAGNPLGRSSASTREMSPSLLDGFGCPSPPRSPRGPGCSQNPRPAPGQGGRRVLPPTAAGLPAARWLDLISPYVIDFLVKQFR